MVKIIFFGILINCFLKVLKDPITPKQGVVLNILSILLLSGMILFELETSNTSPLTSLKSGDATFEKFLISGKLIFTDHVSPLILLSLQFLGVLLFRKKPKILIGLPILFLFFWEIFSCSPFFFDNDISKLALLFLPLAVFFADFQTETLSISLQILPSLFIFIPVAFGFPWQNLFTFGVWTIVISIFLAIGSYSMSALPSYKRISWFVPLISLSIQIQLPTFWIVKYLVCAFCFPGFFFQEIVIAELFYASLILILQRMNRTQMSFLLKQALGLIFSGYVVLTFFDGKVLEILGNRIVYSLYLMGENIGITFGSISPYLTPGIIIFVLIVFLAGFLDTNLSDANEIIKKRPAKSILILCLMLHVFPGIFLSYPKRVFPSLIINFLKSYPWEEKLINNPEKFQNIVAKMEKIQEFPSQIVKNSPPDLKNVLIIIAESYHTRYSSFYNWKEETQPELKKYRDHLTLFTRIFANFASSEDADFCVWNGLISAGGNIGSTNPGIKCPSIFRILHNYGYYINHFYSGDKIYRDFGTYLQEQNINEIFDFSNMPNKDKYLSHPWGIDEKCTRDAIKQQILFSKERSQKFCMTYKPVIPHHPFKLLDPRFFVFKPTEEEIKRGTGTLALYKNQVLYMDSIIGDLMAFLKDEGLLDSTIVVIVGDHGEQLGENGVRGHGYTTRPSITNVFCSIYNSQFPNYSLNATVGSQIDILPTVLDLLNIPIPPDQYYQGTSLFNPKRPEKIFLYSNEESAMVKNEIYFRIMDEEILPYFLSFKSASSEKKFTPINNEIPEAEKKSLVKEVNDFKSLQMQFLSKYEKKATLPKSQAKD
ncbi:MAG: sulfatase-like hydrolase/transferase [Candidatus Riflebacteria bacterium]|nr:sulfatase-like hydrolase/transferase [Candidatus Riflebacteria bacterium]